MPVALRVAALPLGVLCFLAVFVQGTVKVSGAEIPTVEGLVARIVVCVLGLALLFAAVFWQDPRPKTKTYEVISSSMSISVPVTGPDGKVKYKTAKSGGEIIEVSAASFEKSADGKNFIFKDRDGAAVQQFRTEHVNHIRLKPKS